MNEAEILAYQREQFAAKGMSASEVDRVFGTGAWAYETRVTAQEAGDPYPFTPLPVAQEAGFRLDIREEQGFEPPTPLGPPPRAIDSGGVTMVTNGHAVLPGAPPPGVMLTTYTNGGSVIPGGTSEIGLPALLSLLVAGRSIALGFIRMLIAKVGWQAIAGVLGTALAAKVLAMLNDGGSDDRDILAAGGAGTGVKIVKRWRANNTNFWMDSAGYMYAERRNGVIKRWKPKKPIVMVRGRTTLAGAVKAQRYLDHMWRTVAKRTKALKLA